MQAGARLILVVEGETDRQYAELAVERAARPELLQGIQFREAGANAGGTAGGAALAVMQALVTHASAPVPVAVLLDNDEPGQQAAAMLRQIGSKTKLWQEGKQLFTYRSAFKSGQKSFGYEAEDLWPDHLAMSFLAEHPEADRGKAPLPGLPGCWHWDIAAPAKGAYVKHLRLHATAADCTRWVAFLEQIRHATGIGEPDLTAPSPLSTPSADLALTDASAPSAEEPWAPRRDFLTAVRTRIARDLESAGLNPRATHARGAYVRVDFGPLCGPYAKHHLAVRTRQDRATVALIITSEPTTAANVEALEDLLDAAAASLAQTLPTPPATWGPGQAGATRAVAISDAPGLGYAGGNVDGASTWIKGMCIGWASVLTRLASDAESADSHGTDVHRKDREINPNDP